MKAVMVKPIFLRIDSTMYFSAPAGESFIVFRICLSNIQNFSMSVFHAPHLDLPDFLEALRAVHPIEKQLKAIVICGPEPG
jgi:hypothetical protein